MQRNVNYYGGTCASACAHARMSACMYVSLYVSTHILPAFKTDKLAFCAQCGIALALAMICLMLARADVWECLLAARSTGVASAFNDVGM